MRDVLIHEYFGVNQERVWNAIKKDLRPLKKEIIKLIRQDEDLS